MEFQGKMHEACQKFESMEEEHLAQMITFIIKMNQVLCTFVCVFGRYSVTLSLSLSLSLSLFNQRLSTYVLSHSLSL